MGVIKRGILGGFSGSVANVVGGSWKGIAYMRSKPLSVANPKTAAQTGQRTKFSAVVSLASILLVDIIKPCWDRFAQLQSGYNAFVSNNIDAFSTSGVLTYANLKIAIGSLLGIESFATGEAPADQLFINSANNSGTGNGLATDEMYVVAYNETQDVWGSYSAVGVRNGAQILVDQPVVPASNDVIHVWACFRKADGTLVSNTSYGSFTQA